MNAYQRLKFLWINKLILEYKEIEVLVTRIDVGLLKMRAWDKGERVQNAATYSTNAN